MNAAVTEVLVSAGLGLRRGTTLVTNSTPAWCDAYASIEPVLSRTVADLALDLQHVGSTAVAGLRAKPILDVAAGVSAAIDAGPGQLVDALVRIGFVDLGLGVGSVGRLLVFEVEPEVRAIHLHVVRYGGDHWRHYVDFRDALRGSAALRRRYETLKCDLATHYRDDRRAYTNGKAEFIRRVLQT